MWSSDNISDISPISLNFLFNSYLIIIIFIIIIIDL